MMGWTTSERWHHVNIFYRKIPYTKDQFFHQYTALSKNETHHAFLESGRGGRYSFAGIQPAAIAVSTEEGLLFNENGQEVLVKGNPIHALVSIINERHVSKQPDLPDFQGGAVGWISYDYVRFIEQLPELAVDDIQLPDVFFLFFNKFTFFQNRHLCFSIILTAVQARAPPVL